MKAVQVHLIIGTTLELDQTSNRAKSYKTVSIENNMRTDLYLK